MPAAPSRKAKAFQFPINSIELSNITKTTGAETRASGGARITESTGYRLNYPAVDYQDEHTERARWAMEQLHGTVNAAVREETDAQELLSCFRDIVEAATHVADTLCQGNPEVSRLPVLPIITGARHPQKPAQWTHAPASARSRGFARPHPKGRQQLWRRA